MKKLISSRVLVAILLGMSCVLSILLYRGFSKTDKKIVIVDKKAEENIEKPIIQGGETLETNEKAKENQQATKRVDAIIDEKTNLEQKNRTQSNVSNKIINKIVDVGFQKKEGRNIDTIIVHSSYDALGKDPYSADGIIKEYAEYGVSAHYLIGRGGAVYRLVEDKNIAYHAGVSKVPDGRTNVNDFSIGIELINTKTDKFTEKQYVALRSLISQLKKEYKIKYVLGHNQIAPNRKDDPWNFDWNNLK